MAHNLWILWILVYAGLQDCHGMGFQCKMDMWFEYEISKLFP